MDCASLSGYFDPMPVNQFYSRAHFRRVSPRPDTPEEIAARIKRNEAAKQVAREVAEKYPSITPENFAEAEAFQRRRLLETGAAS